MIAAVPRYANMLSVTHTPSYTICRRVGSCMFSGSLSHVCVRRLISRPTLTYTIWNFGSYCPDLSCIGSLATEIVQKTKSLADQFSCSLATPTSAIIHIAEQKIQSVAHGLTLAVIIKQHRTSQSKKYKREKLGIFPHIPANSRRKVLK